MAYIGKEPIVGNFQKCDAITVVNGQAAYTLQVSSTNVVPESENHILVSLNGILQAPGAANSFTVSGSTLTFVSNLATGDVIDFVILLGNVLDLGTPSDGTVTNAKLAQDIISGETALASEPADTDEFLVSDAGTLKRIDYSLIKGSGKCLQVVTGTTTTKVTNSTDDLADTGLTVNITPASSSNKVLIMGTQANCFKSVDNAGTSMHLRLFRDTTEILEIANRILITDTTLEQAQNACFHCLDSPSSTSQITYKTQFRNHADLASVSVQNEATGKSTIIAMEISG